MGSKIFLPNGLLKIIIILIVIVIVIYNYILLGLGYNKNYVWSSNNWNKKKITKQISKNK